MRVAVLAYHFVRAANQIPVGLFRRKGNVCVFAVGGLAMRRAFAVGFVTVKNNFSVKTFALFGTYFAVVAVLGAVGFFSICP